MKISIIIPAYNTEKTLSKTINSIEYCGLTDYEIILVDDGSNDGTPALCDHLAEISPLTQCVHQENRGVSAARNHGLSLAQGDYVWFFDSDDLVDPGSMEYVEQIINEQQPDLLMFGMSFDYYHGKKMYERLELYYDTECVLTAKETWNKFSELYHNNMLTSSCNKIIRRSILVDNHIEFDTNLFSLEDFQFSLRAMQYCNSVYIIPRAIYRFAQRDRRSKERGGRDNRRMARIPDIAEYLQHFEPFLPDHPKVLVDLYFSMLREKLESKQPEEMAEIAARFLASTYHSGSNVKLYSAKQEMLARQLENHEFRDLYKQFRKAERRNKMVVLIKRTPIYRLLRGSRTRRVRF